jgi:outer membrane protein
MSRMTTLLIIMIMLPLPRPSAGETLSLRRCLELAAERNLSLRQHDERIAIAAAAEKAQRAAMWPKLSLGSSASYVSELARLEFPFSIPGATGIEVGAKDQYDISAGLSLPLFTGMRTRNLVRSTEEYHRQAEYAREASRNAVLLRVHLIYYGLQANLLGQDILGASMRRIGNHLSQTRRLLEQAQVTAFDTLEASNRLLEVETDLTELRHQYRVNAGNLSYLLDVPAVDSVDALRTEVMPQEIDSREEYERIAQENRPELALGDHAILESEYRKRAAGSSYFPQIHASASYHYARPGVNYFENEWMDYYAVGVQLQWELWNMGRRGSEVKQAERAVDISRLERERVWKEIRQEVSTAYEELVSARERILLQRRLVDQERERYRIVFERYAVGLATSFDLSDAEESLTTAELRLAAGYIEFEMKRAELSYAAGVIGQ